jgi:hypothetical protein
MAFVLIIAGCAASPPESTESSTAEIEGSLARARALAVRDAYRDAEVSDFTDVELDAFPPAARNKIRRSLELNPDERLESTAFFATPMGRVYVTERSHTWEGSAVRYMRSDLDFFSEAGLRVLVASMMTEAGESPDSGEWRYAWIYNGSFLDLD